jgi:hypothetical protein
VEGVFLPPLNGIWKEQTRNPEKKNKVQKKEEGGKRT